MPCLRTRTWPRSSSCSPTSSRSRATSRSACSRTVARRRAIRDTADSIAQLALDGKAEAAAGDRQDDRGQDRRDRRGRRGARADEAQGGVPPDVVAFTRLPGLAPKTARRIWRDLGVTTIADLRKAAEAQQPADALRARAEGRGERAARRSPRRSRPPPSRPRRCSGPRFRPCSTRSRSCARIRRP